MTAAQMSVIDRVLRWWRGESSDTGVIEVATSGIVFDVNEAVEGQLTTDGWPEPHDQDGAMGGDYGYDGASMAGFLLAVRTRLSGMGHDFVFDPEFVDSAVSKKLAALKVAIAGKTT
jgi:hypothetical protein